MIRPLLHLRRVRLELDRTVRLHSFFARAIRGDLARPAYMDLLLHLGELVRGITGGLATDLAHLAQRDREKLEAARRSRRERTACGPSRHFEVAALDYTRCLSPELAYHTCLAVLGTSWACEAAERLAPSTARATSFLAALGAQGPKSVSYFSSEVAPGSDDSLHACAFAELSRGALLGLATYLDSAWPAPTFAAEIARAD